MMSLSLRFNLLFRVDSARIQLLRHNPAGTEQVLVSVGFSLCLLVAVVEISALSCTAFVLLTFLTNVSVFDRSMDTPIVPNSTEPVWNEECVGLVFLLGWLSCYSTCRYHLKWTPGYEQHRFLNIDVMHKVQPPHQMPDCCLAPIASAHSMRKDLIHRKHLGSVSIDLRCNISRSTRNHICFANALHPYQRFFTRQQRAIARAVVSCFGCLHTASSTQHAFGVRYPLLAIASSKDQLCDRGQIFVSILRYPSYRHRPSPLALPATRS
jgi:hypothetical protein